MTGPGPGTNSSQTQHHLFAFLCFRKKAEYVKTSKLVTRVNNEWKHYCSYQSCFHIELIEPSYSNAYFSGLLNRAWTGTSTGWFHITKSLTIPCVYNIHNILLATIHTVAISGNKAAQVYFSQLNWTNLVYAETERQADKQSDILYCSCFFF